MTWLERLDECDRLIAEKDWNGLKKWIYWHRRDVGDFMTCACGEQDKRIPRDKLYDDGRPADELLQDLGADFYAYWIVIDDSTADARATLAAIERRAAEILAEVTA